MPMLSFVCWLVMEIGCRKPGMDGGLEEGGENAVILMP
jgi:hypothetical protein